MTKALIVVAGLTGLFYMLMQARENDRVYVPGYTSPLCEMYDYTSKNLCGEKTY